MPPNTLLLPRGSMSFFRIILEKPIDVQPEVMNPELYLISYHPRILPPTQICQGTDKIFAEELKYSSLIDI